MNWEMVAAVAGMASGLAALSGLFFQRRWTLDQIRAARKDQQISVNIEVPIRAKIDELAELDTWVKAYLDRRSGVTLDALQLKGMGLFRGINYATLIASKFNKQKLTEWLDVSTETLEEVLDQIDETNRTLSCQTLRRDIDRLRQNLTSLMKDASGS